MSGDMSDFVIAMHMDGEMAFPEAGEDMSLEEMEEYIERNREELLDGFGSVFMSQGFDADDFDISAFQTRSGDTGMEIAFGLSDDETCPWTWGPTSSSSPRGSACTW